MVDPSSTYSPFQKAMITNPHFDATQNLLRNFPSDSELSAYFSIRKRIEELQQRAFSFLATCTSLGIKNVDDFHAPIIEQLEESLKEYPKAAKMYQIEKATRHVWGELLEKEGPECLVRACGINIRTLPTTCEIYRREYITSDACFRTTHIIKRIREGMYFTCNGKTLYFRESPDLHSHLHIVDADENGKTLRYYRLSPGTPPGSLPKFQFVPSFITLVAAFNATADIRVAKVCKMVFESPEMSYLINDSSGGFSGLPILVRDYLTTQKTHDRETLLTPQLLDEFLSPLPTTSPDSNLPFYTAMDKIRSET